MNKGQIALDSLQEKIKQKLRLRGFTEKQLLNNRGLISATVDEVILMISKRLTDKL